ncbi:hypothetical protein SY88_09950 [Clostridiales bacterium PH28_bin88]|nr:hypothetical protein SY88_09950 [Clostridiales bacterium PH28_bin88]
MKVQKYMTPDPVTLRPQDSIFLAAKTFLAHHVDGAPIVDERGLLLGLITKTHLYQAMTGGLPLTTTVERVMTTGVVTVSPDDDLDKVFSLAVKRLPVVDKEGYLVGMITATDLLTAFYDKYRSAVDQLQAILDSAYNGIIAVDREGKIILFNQKAELLVGCSAAEVKGLRITEVIPNNGLMEVLQTGEPRTGQRLVVGSTTVISDRTPITSQGRVIGALAVFQDVSELQKAMEELVDVRKFAHTLETILETAYEGIIVVDPDGIVTMFNRAYEDFLGIKREEVIGRHVTEVIENTRMHIVVKTGVPEIGLKQKIMGQEMVVQRIPIFEDNRIIGAVGKVMFKDVKDLRAMAERLHALESKVEYYETELKKIRGSKYTFDHIVGTSGKMLAVKNMALKAAQGHSNVLITGESGTGKELLAHAIHHASPRASGPFIRLNCAAIPQDLLEAELFGYEEGAFTGARKRGKPGKFELANRGTIFLDEIGDMPLPMQAKILRVLQEKEIERVGGVETLKVDVRVVAATNKDLQELVEQKLFRNDLFYRLNVITLAIPPLRERNEDIPILAQYWLEKLCDEMGIPGKRFAPEALEYFRAYQWRGNVREMINTVERLVNTVDKTVIEGQDLPAGITGWNQAERDTPAARGTLEKSLCDTERSSLLEAMEKAGGNKTVAARILGIHRSTLYDKLHKYGLA